MVHDDEREQEQILQWIDDFFSSLSKDRPNLVTVLQKVQDQFGYLPKPALRKIAKNMELTPANVFGVATFYNQFRFTPPGKYPIKVCMGTACAIKRADLIVDQWKRRLEIEVGEVTDDREYSLDRVDCVGCCTLAPVTVIGDEVIAEMAPTKVDGILLRHRIKREQEQLKSGDEQ
jgi:NADH:ubiquinone oxidoreductase subunit E